VSARAELLQAKGYDKYKPGTPSHKLHLKNLHRKKEISPDELLRLFGSFTAPGQKPEYAHAALTCAVVGFALTAACMYAHRDIEIKVMTGRMSGQAFVTLASQELAGQALAAVHGYVLHGLPIFVVPLSPSLSQLTPAALPHHVESCRDVPCAAYGLLCGRRRVAHAGVRTRGKRQGGGHERDGTVRTADGQHVQGVESKREMLHHINTSVSTHTHHRGESAGSLNVYE
jgi:RNA recognition motif-containing protein